MRDTHRLHCAGFVVPAVLAVLMFAAQLAPAQFHEPTYITGGYNNVSTIHTRGVFMVNGSTADTVPSSLKYMNHPVRPCCWGAVPVRNVVMALAVVDGNTEVRRPRRC